MPKFTILTYNLTDQLKIGQQFELSVKNLLEIKGWVVSLNQSKDLATLRKYDLAIKKDGCSFWVEIKKDVMSERTGNICIDYDSLSKSESSIFILGLPNQYGTDIYKMPLQTIYRYAKDYPIQKAVGQWGLKNALIPKNEFIYLPFIKQFTMNEPLNPYAKRSNICQQSHASVLSQ